MQPRAAEQITSPWPLVAICVGYFMVILDTTVVNVALPAISAGLRTGTTGLQWTVDAYSLTFAAGLLSAGALGDRRGAKGVFQAGIAVFLVCSLACGLAPSAAVLVAARAAQGVGAALTVPSSLALLQAAYPDRAARRRALGLWGGVAGVAAAAGPVVGGALVSGLGWRSAFFLNVPVGAAGLALVARVVSAPPRRPHGTDVAGQVIGACCLGALAASLIETGSTGWGSPVVVVGLGVALLSGIAFVVVEHRAEAPLLPLGLFSSAAFSAATAVGLCINLGFYGALFVMTLYLQQVRGYSALLAGVALLPQMVMVAVGSLLSGRLAARTGPRMPMLLGLVLGGAGFLALLVVRARLPYVVLVAPLMATGFGISLTMPAATMAVMESAPADRAGLASGTINAARQVGGVLGVAVLGSLVADGTGVVGGLRVGMAVAGGVFLLGAGLTARAGSDVRS